MERQRIAENCAIIAPKRDAHLPEVVEHLGGGVAGGPTDPADVRDLLLRVGDRKNLAVGVRLLRVAERRLRARILLAAPREGRVALDELLNRWPEWDIDRDTARLAPTSTVRGWEYLRILVG